MELYCKKPCLTTTHCGESYVNQAVQVWLLFLFGVYLLLKIHSNDKIFTKEAMVEIYGDHQREFVCWILLKNCDPCFTVFFSFTGQISCLPSRLEYWILLQYSRYNFSSLQHLLLLLRNDRSHTIMERFIFSRKLENFV